MTQQQQRAEMISADFKGDGQTGDLAVFVAVCLQFLRQKLPASASMVEEKTTALSEQFQQLAYGASQQSQEIDKLGKTTGSLNYKGKDIPITDFAKLFNNALQFSVDQATGISDSAQQMIAKLDATMEKLQKMDEHTGGIQAMDKKLKMLAMNAQSRVAIAGDTDSDLAIVLKEVNELADGMGPLAMNIQRSIGEIIFNVQSAQGVLNEVAAIDISKHKQMKDNMDTLMSLLMKNNAEVGKMLEGNAKTAQTLSRNIGAMVMDMQFQDRNTQYMENSCIVMQYLEGLVGLQAQGETLPPARELGEELMSRIKMSELRDMLHEALHLKGMADALTPANGAAADDDDDVDLF